MTDLRRDLTTAAMQVAAILNLLRDDDERERLQQHFERVLNDELYAGSVNRAQVRGLVAELQLARIEGPPCTVTDLFSRKVNDRRLSLTLGGVDATGASEEQR